MRHARSLTLVVLALAASAPALAQAAPPTIREVARETARSGWPHAGTGREVAAFATRFRVYEAAMVANGSTSTRALCASAGAPYGIARVSCSLRQDRARWTIRIAVSPNGATRITARTPVRMVP